VQCGFFGSAPLSGGAVLLSAREGRVDTDGLGRMVAVIDQTRATIAELDLRLEAMSAP